MPSFTVNILYSLSLTVINPMTNQSSELQIQIILKNQEGEKSLKDTCSRLQASQPQDVKTTNVDKTV